MLTAQEPLKGEKWRIFTKKPTNDFQQIKVKLTIERILTSSNSKALFQKINKAPFKLY